MSDVDLPDKDYKKSLRFAVGVEDVDYGALKQLTLGHGTTIEDADRDKRGSFEHVSFQVPTFNFDDKYSMQGRFAFNVDELPIPKHRDRQSHPENHLKIRSVSPEGSSMEDSLNTG